jgi:4'-phosphopantetheinyl transferase
MNDQNDRWESPPALLELDAGAVHVWRVDLDAPAHDRDALRSTLTPDELARAARFVFVRDRERFVVGRGLLRAILVRYMGDSPSALRFGYNMHGKPFLSAPDSDALQFNVSHTKQLALIAVRRRGQVGIDIERIREPIDYAPIAAEMFSAAERAALYATPEPLRLSAFFGFWTRKEAYIKARGEGLGSALNQFDTTLRSDELVGVVRVEDSAGDELWALRALHPAQGYIAAVVVEGALAQLRLYE